MNNKASKRLLAASVASLMLVVAFCGFTYAGDDADAEGNGEVDTPYVKNVVVAVYNTTPPNVDGKVEFKIITTQNTDSAGSGITHVGIWKRVGSGEPLSNNPALPAIYSHFDICATTSKNTHTFTVKGISTGDETVKLYYELTSTVGTKTIVQMIYYDIVVKVVPALPSEHASINQSGYVGVEYKGIAGDLFDFTYEAGLMLYAEDLPDGLSMNIDGTITGVPKQSVESEAMTTTVTVHNGTGYTKTYQIKWTILDQVASFDAYIAADDSIVKRVSDDRYLVVQGTQVIVFGNVIGYKNGSMEVDNLPNDITYSISTGEGSKIMVLKETGERQIKVSYTFDMDADSTGMEPIEIVDYITVVIVDVVEDATTGMGLVAGNVPPVSATP